MDFQPMRVGMCLVVVQSVHRNHKAKLLELSLFSWSLCANSIQFFGFHFLGNESGFYGWIDLINLPNENLDLELEVLKEVEKKVMASNLFPISRAWSRKNRSLRFLKDERYGDREVLRLYYSKVLEREWYLNG